MEFEIKDLEMIEGTAGHHFQSPAMPHSATPNSMILNELHKENEELQNKLKLNYRRLLLFETENNKLVEEKNKLFFETQNYFQKNSLLTEKNEALETRQAEMDQQQKLLTEKLGTFEKVNRTQMAEIRRFAKFHAKIQDVVKPFIVNLKKQVHELRAELTQSQKVNANLMEAYQELGKKTELTLGQKNGEILSLQAEKTGLVQTYEEQIHSFSKEILDLQQKNEGLHKEISRLKKAVEFKNYFENEVIRFKRTHEEDQARINELTQKRAALEARVMNLEQSLQEAGTETGRAMNKMQDMEASLEVTRAQFSKKIDELAVAMERINRLEKLNNQLSREISPSA